MPIVLQLKSTQDRCAFDDISDVIRLIQRESGYRIRGHEVHQLKSVMKNTALSERATLVSDFCSANELEFLSYHAPIFDKGENFWEERWRGEIQDSILQTMDEAEIVRSKSAISSDVVVVFHLTNNVPHSDLPLTAERRAELQSRAQSAFVAFLKDNDISGRKGVVLAAENGFPKYYEHHAIAGPYHPKDVNSLESYGIRSVLDLSHYQLYSNYIRYGKSNQLGDLDREIHGTPAPCWDKCIETLSHSLIQLHISDARGLDESGEGLTIGAGEIPIRDVLFSVHALGRLVRGTIELSDGHLNHAASQLDSARWLVRNVRAVLE